MNKGGFSLLRLIGVTKIKNDITKVTKVPWTKQGRKAKFNPLGKWIK